MEIATAWWKLRVQLEANYNLSLCKDLRFQGREPRGREHQKKFADVGIPAALPFPPQQVQAFLVSSLESASTHSQPHIVSLSTKQEATYFLGGPPFLLQISAACHVYRQVHDA